MSSYLNSRKQFVKLNNVSYEYKYVKCGVPQGSILGPLLFILYLNDICKVSDILEFILFADDTNIFCSGHDINTMTPIINNELVKLKKLVCIK